MASSHTFLMKLKAVSCTGRHTSQIRGSTLLKWGRPDITWAVSSADFVMEFRGASSALQFIPVYTIELGWDVSLPRPHDARLVRGDIYIPPQQLSGPLRH